MTAYLAYPSGLSPTILPSLAIHWYSILHLLGYLVVFAFFLHHLRANSYGEELRDGRRFFFWFIIGYLAGARIFALLLYESAAELMTAPWILIWPFDAEMSYVGVQGMSFTGGILGAAFALAVFHWKNRVRVLVWADALVLGLPLMFALVRLGNFANQELYGPITDAPWGVLFPEARPVSLAEPGIRRLAVSLGIESIEDSGFVNLPRHPVQLYEALVGGIGVWVAVWLSRFRRSALDGRATVVYLLALGVLQFLFAYLRRAPIRDRALLELAPGAEPTRLGTFSSVVSLTGSQLLSLGLLVGGIGMAVALRRYRRSRPGVETYVPSGDG